MAKSKILIGTALDEQAMLSLSELCAACGVHAEYIMELVAEGALEPKGKKLRDWRFSGDCLRKTRIAVRLQRDLQVNVAGVALALDLLEEIESLRGKFN